MTYSYTLNSPLIMVFVRWHIVCVDHNALWVYLPYWRYCLHTNVICSQVCIFSFCLLPCIGEMVCLCYLGNWSNISCNGKGNKLNNKATFPTCRAGSGHQGALSRINFEQNMYAVIAIIMPLIYSLPLSTWSSTVLFLQTKHIHPNGQSKAC